MRRKSGRSYRDFESRLPRGRSYVRNGSVLDLQISRRELRATVSGSSLYHVSVSIGILSKPRWQSICRDCAGGIDSLVELLQGRLSKAVMQRVCEPAKGLFPQPSEITFTCSCPDYAFMCKHIAAVLYGVGARLDQQPELLFTLRAVDQTELISDVDSGLLSKTGPDAAKVLADDDLSALFGLDMADGAPPSTTSATTKAMPPKAAKSERKKSLRATALPERVMSGSAGTPKPKKRRTTKRAARVVSKSIEKTPAPRTAPQQLPTTTKRRIAVVSPERPSAAVPITSSATRTPARTVARGKGRAPTASARAHRT